MPGWSTASIARWLLAWRCRRECLFSVETGVSKPGVRSSRPLETTQAAVYLLQQFASRAISALVFPTVAQVKKHRLLSEQPCIVIHDPGQKPRRRIGGRGDAKSIRNEGKHPPLTFILCYQAKQDALLKGPPEVEIANDRFPILAKTVNAAVPLFKPVWVKRQFKMDQVVTTLMKI